MAREQGATKQGRVDGNNSRPDNILVYQGSCNLYHFDDCVHHQLNLIKKIREEKKKKKEKTLTGPRAVRTPKWPPVLEHLVGNPVLSGNGDNSRDSNRLSPIRAVLRSSIFTNHRRHNVL